MKKMLSVIMAATMVLALTACGGKDNSTSVNEESQSGTENLLKEDKDSAPQESGVTETINQENPYTLEVQLTGEKTAEVKLKGVKIDTSVEGARWGVSFDDKYSVMLKVYEAGQPQCDTTVRKDNPDGTYDMLVLSFCEYEIMEDTILFHADFSSTENPDVEDIVDTSKFITATIIVDETGTGYKPITLALTDMEINNNVSADADVSQTQENNAEPTGDGANQYAGLYTSNRGKLTVTDNTITLVFDGTEYNIDYLETDIKDQNGIGEFIFSSNGTEVKIFFGKDRKIAEVYVGNDGAGFTRGESGDADNQTPVISGKFSAMAGTYKGDKSTLTIKEDGSFTYEFSSSSLQETFNGQLSEGFKSGDKVQCGSNNIEFLFPEDYRYFSLVVWDANGNNMGGEDLSKR